MPPGVAYTTAALLTVLGMVRGHQAWRVVRYQRNMRKLPTYSLRADQIPLSRRKLFLGRGFRWTQRHTQRLRDTLRPEVQHYVQPGRLYRWARRKEVAWESVVGLSRIASLLHRRAWWNPLAPLPALGGLPALHAVEPDEQDVWMDLGERVDQGVHIGHRPTSPRRIFGHRRPQRRRTTIGTTLAEAHIVVRADHRDIDITYLEILWRQRDWQAEKGRDAHEAHTTREALDVDRTGVATLAEVITRDLPQVIGGIIGIQRDHGFGTTMVGLVATVIREVLNHYRR